jgi:hypothetical protein
MIILPCYLLDYPFFLFFFRKNQTIKEKRSDEVVREKNSEDGKIVLDIIEAIHAAEKKQADVDAYMYSEERRKLKVLYPFSFYLFAYLWSSFAEDIRFNTSFTFVVYTLIFLTYIGAHNYCGL